MYITTRKQRLARIRNLFFLGLSLLALASLFTLWGYYSEGWVDACDLHAWKLLCAKNASEKEGYYMLSLVVGTMGLLSIGTFISTAPK